MTVQLDRVDPELGPVRLCRRCDEEWPLDEEYWRISRIGRRGGPIFSCLSCQREANRLTYERRLAKEPTFNQDRYRRMRLTNLDGLRANWRRANARRLRSRAAA